MSKPLLLPIEMTEKRRRLRNFGVVLFTVCLLCFLIFMCVALLTNWHVGLIVCGILIVLVPPFCLLAPDNGYESTVVELCAFFGDKGEMDMRNEIRRLERFDCIESRDLLLQDIKPICQYIVDNPKDRQGFQLICRAALDPIRNRVDSIVKEVNMEELRKPLIQKFEEMGKQQKEGL